MGLFSQQWSLSHFWPALTGYFARYHPASVPQHPSAAQFRKEMKKVTKESKSSAYRGLEGR